MKVRHINSGIELEVLSDDTNGVGGGIAVLLDPDTQEEHTVGGYEFDMEYEAI